MNTHAVEDYLKAIYKIEMSQGKVTNSALAELLSVTPASATNMTKRLAEMNLVAYEPYQGVTLTEAGQKIALEVIRHHRLVELYLAEALNVPWDKVHEEAEKWEHVLSEELEERIDEVLGNPTVDPHGAPIPDREGKVVERDCEQLSALHPGQSAVIAEVSDHNPEMLRYLGKMKLYPDATIRVVEVAPFNGPVTIHIDGAEHALGREVASHILVTKVTPADKK